MFMIVCSVMFKLLLSAKGDIPYICVYVYMELRVYHLSR